MRFGDNDQENFAHIRDYDANGLKLKHTNLWIKGYDTHL